MARSKTTPKRQAAATPAKGAKRVANNEAKKAKDAKKARPATKSVAKSASKRATITKKPTAKKPTARKPTPKKATTTPVRPKAAAAKRPVATKVVAKKAAPKRATRATTKGRKGSKKAPARPAVPVLRVVKVRELDPIAKCGPATSVEQLFRVDEQAGGNATVHLVFFDRHGWYCVHGPRCAAVADVHSHNRSLHGARAGGR